MSFDESPLSPELGPREAPEKPAPQGDAVAARAQSVAAEGGSEDPQCSIAELPLGTRVVLGAPDAMTPTVLRLLEMGLTPGATLAITRRAPGGDPVEVRVRGTRLCVRREDLARFPVAPSRAGKPRDGT
jgi:ferrous iron transport protein A